MLYNRDKTVYCDPTGDGAVAVHVGVMPEHADRLSTILPPEVHVTTYADEWNEWGEPDAPGAPVVVSATAVDEGEARTILAAWLAAVAEHSIPLCVCPPLAELPALYVALTRGDDFAAPLTASWLMQHVGGEADAVLVLDDSASLLLTGPASAPLLAVIRMDEAAVVAG